MAARDVEFYFYLKEALKNKLRYPDADSFRFGKYNFDYEYIFQQARRVFPAKYNIGHSHFNGTPISYLKEADLKKLNFEYAQDLVAGFGGLDKKQADNKEVDSVLVEYENDLTAPEEPDSFHQELESHQLPSTGGEKLQEDQPTQQGQQGNEPPSPQTPQQQPPRQTPPRVVQPGKPMTKEEYGKYKEENKEDRDKRAKDLWEKRKKRALIKGPGGKSGWGFNPLEGKFAKWLADKTGLTKLGKWLADKTGISQYAKWLADKTGLTAVNNALNTAKTWLADKTGLTAVNNALNTAKTWLGNATGYTNAMNGLRSALGNLQSWAGNGLKSLAQGGFNLARSGLGNFLSAIKTYFGQISGGAVATQVALIGARSLIVAVIANPITWAVFVITALFVFTQWYDNFISNLDCNKQTGEMRIQKRQGGINGLGLEARNGEQIEYIIEVTYLLACQSRSLPTVVVSDRIPDGTVYVPKSATSGFDRILGNGPTGVYDESTRTVTWSFENFPMSKPALLSFAIQPNEEIVDTWVTNQATVSYTLPSLNATGKIIDSQSRSFQEIVNEAAQSTGMEPSLLKAFLRVEAPQSLKYSEEEFIKFSTPGWWEGLEANASTLAGNDPTVIRGYGYNTCAYTRCAAGADVRGVAQFEIRTWNGVAAQLKFADGHEPDRRNARDAIFGSALHNKQNAEIYTGTANVEWTEDVIRAAGRVYCAGPSAARNPAAVRDSACMQNGVPYDDLLWGYYKEFSAQP